MSDSKRPIEELSEQNRSDDDQQSADQEAVRADPVGADGNASDNTGDRNAADLDSDVGNGDFGDVDQGVGGIANPEDEFRQPIEMYPRRDADDFTPPDPIESHDSPSKAENLSSDELAFEVSPRIRKTGDPLYIDDGDVDSQPVDMDALQVSVDDDPIPLRGNRFKPPADGRRFGGFGADGTRQSTTQPSMRLVPKSRPSGDQGDSAASGNRDMQTVSVARDRLTEDEIQHERERTRADIVALKLQKRHFGLDRRLADAGIEADTRADSGTDHQTVADQTSDPTAFEQTDQATDDQTATGWGSVDFDGETIAPAPRGVAPKEPSVKFVPPPSPDELDMTPPGAVPESDESHLPAESESDLAAEDAGAWQSVQQPEHAEHFNAESIETDTALGTGGVEVDSDTDADSTRGSYAADARTPGTIDESMAPSSVAQIDDLFRDDYEFDADEDEISGRLSPVGGVSAAELYDDDDDLDDYTSQDLRGTAQKSVFEIDAPVEKETLRVEPTTPASFKTMRNLVSERVHRHARKRRSDEQELEREVSGYRMKRSARWIALGGTGAVMLLLVGGYLALDEPNIERKPGIRDILKNMPPTNPNTIGTTDDPTGSPESVAGSESVIVLPEPVADSPETNSQPGDPARDEQIASTGEQTPVAVAEPDSPGTGDSTAPADGVTTESGLLDRNVVVTENLVTNEAQSRAESAPAAESAADTVDREKRLNELLERVNQTIAEQELSEVENADATAAEGSSSESVTAAEPASNQSSNASAGDDDATAVDTTTVAAADEAIESQQDRVGVETSEAESAVASNGQQTVSSVESSAPESNTASLAEGTATETTGVSGQPEATPNEDVIDETVVTPSAPVESVSASVSETESAGVAPTAPPDDAVTDTSGNDIALDETSETNAQAPSGAESESESLEGTEQVAAVLLPGTERTTTPEPAPTPTLNETRTTDDDAARRRDSIEAQLDVAWDQIDSLRLTTPVGDNAFETVERILDVDPNNVDALSALNEIRSRYLQWADRAVEDGELDKAIANYQKVVSVDPDRSGTVRQIITELEQQREAVSLTTAANEQAVQVPQPGNADESEEPLQTAALKPSESSKMLRAREQLDELGIDVTIRNLVDLTNEGDYDAVSLLLEAGLSVDSRAGQYGFSPLIVTAIRGDTGMLKLLLENQVDIDGRSSDGRTALMAAAWNGHQYIVDTLLANQASVQIANADGWTALHYAAWQGHSDIVRTLLEKGADPTVRNGDGWTVAETAEKKGFIQILEIIEQSGRGQG